MKALELIKLANQSNTRKSRGIALKEYRSLKRNLRKIAKRGEYSAKFNIRVWGQTGWEQLLAVRFFKSKHKDFKVLIRPHTDEGDGFWDCDTCTITIEFYNK